MRDPGLTNSELEFSEADFCREFEELNKLGAQFLDEAAPGHFYALTQTLKNITREKNPNKIHPWGIGVSSPLRTKISHGQYQPNGKGKYHLYGELAFLWEICSTGERGRFRLAGNASVACILRPSDDRLAHLEQLARWRVDVGDAHGPGCHFHVQIPWGTDATPELRTIDVPRFPSILVSPIDAIEFLLSEIFQERWSRHVVANAEHGFLDSRRRRFERLLDWQRSVIARARSTPVVALKEAKPSSDALKN